MNVGQLIKVLEKFDQDAQVLKKDLTLGYESPMVHVAVMDRDDRLEIEHGEKFVML